MATPLETLSYKNAPDLTAGSTTAIAPTGTPLGGGGGGSWGPTDTTVGATGGGPNLKPVVISTSEPAKTEIGSIQTKVGTITEAQKIAQQTADQKKLEQTALYEKNPYWVRPEEMGNTEAYNKRIAEMRASGVIPPAEVSGVDEEIKKTEGTGDITSDAQKIADDRKKMLEDENARITSEYEEHKANLAKAYSGKDITPEQQAQLDNLNAKFDQLKALQITANKNYEGGTAAMSLVSGRSRYAPELASGEMSAAINSGIAKLSELEVKRSEAFNSLKEAFVTKNVDKINNAWKQYNDYTDKKTANLKDISNTMAEAEKSQREWTYKVAQDNISNILESSKFSWAQKQDQINNALNQAQLDETKRKNIQDEVMAYKDYQIKLEQLNQGKYIISTNAFGEPIAFSTKTGEFEPGAVSGAPSISNSTKINAYYDAMRTATMKNPTMSKVALAQVKQLLDAGDYDRAREAVLRAAMLTAGVDQQNQAYGRLNAIDGISKIKTLLDEYTAVSGDTNIIKGTIESAAQRIGLTTDPKLASIKQRIMTILQNYRRNMTGVAFSPSESAEYKKILPDITNIGSLNAVKMDNLLDTFNSQQKIFVGGQIGGTNYDIIFKPKVTSLQTYYAANPDLQGKIDSLLDENYSDEEILEAINLPQE